MISSDIILPVSELINHSALYSVYPNFSQSIGKCEYFHISPNIILAQIVFTVKFFLKHVKKMKRGFINFSNLYMYFVNLFFALKTRFEVIHISVEKAPLYMWIVWITVCKTAF